MDSCNIEFQVKLIANSSCDLLLIIFCLILYMDIVNSILINALQILISNYTIIHNMSFPIEFYRAIELSPKQIICVNP